jgi:hypothetical protein
VASTTVVKSGAVGGTWDVYPWAYNSVMAYLRISDDAMDHPKLLQLKDGAFRFWFSANCWCQKHLTDGRILKTSAPHIPHHKANRIRELIAAGLWREDRDAYVVHDFLVHNDSKEHVEERRRRKTERMASWRERRRGALVDRPQATPQAVPVDTPRARSEPSPSTSPHLNREEGAHPTRRLHQSNRPSRMNPAGVVPMLESQFGEFVSRVSPEYPDRGAAYAAVLAWMNSEDDAATARRKSITGSPFVWWQARFDAWKRDDAAKPTVCRRRHSPPCDNDADCTRRYMDEQRGAPAVAS